jgi:predicted aldo/keto reductase-like oxidoreductase
VTHLTLLLHIDVPRARDGDNRIWRHMRHGSQGPCANATSLQTSQATASATSEAATPFAMSHPAMGTILVGMATPQQFEDALAAVQKGSIATRRTRSASRAATDICWRAT